LGNARSFHPEESADLNLTNRAENCNEPEERFIRVLQYYLAGWHIKPKGVKKPYVHDSSVMLATTISRAPDITQCLGSFSDVDMIIQMAPKGSTSPNKVHIHPTSMETDLNIPKT